MSFLSDTPGAPAAAYSVSPSLPKASPASVTSLVLSTAHAGVFGREDDGERILEANALDLSARRAYQLLVALIDAGERLLCGGQLVALGYRQVGSAASVRRENQAGATETYHVTAAVERREFRPRVLRRGDL